MECFFYLYRATLDYFNADIADKFSTLFFQVRAMDTMREKLFLFYIQFQNYDLFLFYDKIKERPLDTCQPVNRMHF